eukprot:m.47319 g.47319  ORF g.47319 m.47319 type:complete len:267 (-) comp10480_c0_seq2:63-863(-)
MGQLISRSFLMGVGAVYPGYMSYKCIKHGDKEELMRWLEYWSVFSFFVGVESFLDTFVSWFPMYYSLKTSFVLYLVFGGGSAVVFKNVLKPKLDEHEAKIDDHLKDAVRRTSHWKDQALASGTTLLRNTAQKAIAEGLVDNLLKGGNKGEQRPSTGVTNTSLAALVESTVGNPPDWLGSLSSPVPPTTTAKRDEHGTILAYHGKISKTIAYDRLRRAGQQNGQYLLWKSPDSGHVYHLTVVKDLKVQDHLIICDEKGKFSLVRVSS